MFDAYTIKKVVPRLVIAIIAIQLSWFIFTEMIHIVNLVAYGVEGLIYAPFGGREQLSAEIILNSMAQGTTFTWTGLIVGGGAATWFLGPLGLLSLGLTIILALLIGVFLLSLRRLIIIALLLLAPIALVAWILPGTEKVWKIWWESFSKLLYVYPIILLLFAAGRAFGSVAAKTNTNNTLKVIVVMLAIYGPFFLIPKTFQLAGSAFGNLAGIVNNSSRGLFDRNKKYRGQKVAENWDKTKGGTRFSERNMLSRGLSRAGGRVAAGPTGWGPGKKAAGVRATNQMIYAQNAKQKNDKLAAWWNDDTVMKALSYESAGQANSEWVNAATTDEERAKRREAVKVAQGIGYSRGNSLAAFGRMGEMGFGFHGPNAHAEMRATAERLSGGNTALQRRLVDDFEYNSKAAGRFDLSRGGDDLEAPAHEQAWNRWNNANLYEHANAKGDNLKNFVSHFEGELGAVDDTGAADMGRRGRAAEFFAELNAMEPNAKGGNHQTIQDALGEQANQDRLNDYYDSMGASNPELQQVTEAYEQTVPDPVVPGATVTTREQRTRVATAAERRQNAQQHVAGHSRRYDAPNPNRA